MWNLITSPPLLREGQPDGAEGQDARRAQAFLADVRGVDQGPEGREEGYDHLRCRHRSLRTGGSLELRPLV